VALVPLHFDGNTRRETNKNRNYLNPNSEIPTSDNARHNPQIPTLHALPLPQLIAATEDSVVEIHDLRSTEAKPEVDDVPGFKVPFSQGHTVSICFVVGTSL